MSASNGVSAFSCRSPAPAHTWKQTPVWGGGASAGTHPLPMREHSPVYAAYSGVLAGRLSSSAHGPGATHLRSQPRGHVWAQRHARCVAVRQPSRAAEWAAVPLPPSAAAATCPSCRLHSHTSSQPLACRGGRRHGRWRGLGGGATDQAPNTSTCVGARTGVGQGGLGGQGSAAHQSPVAPTHSHSPTRTAPHPPARPPTPTHLAQRQDAWRQQADEKHAPKRGGLALVDGCTGGGGTGDGAAAARRAFFGVVSVSAHADLEINQAVWGVRGG